MTKDLFLNTCIKSFFHASEAHSEQQSNTLANYVGYSHFSARTYKVLLCKDCSISSPYRASCRSEAFAHSKVLDKLML